MVSFCMPYFSETWGGKRNMRKDLAWALLDRKVIYLRYNMLMLGEHGCVSARLLYGNNRDDVPPQQSAQIIVFMSVYGCYSQLLEGLTALVCWAWVHQTPLRRLTSHTAVLMHDKKRNKRFSLKDKESLLARYYFFHFDIRFFLFVFYSPLWGSSLRACLLGGELLWSWSW